MVVGDGEVIKLVDSIVGSDVIPFAQLPSSDLSGYLDEIDVADAQVSDSGELTSQKLGVVKGDPVALQYMLGRAALEGRNKLSKAAIENFLVPRESGVAVAALEQMDVWAQRKPTLSSRLKDIQGETDDIVLSAFTVLSEKERRYIKERAKEFPLNQVLVADETGVATKRISVKYWETGKRYRA